MALLLTLFSMIGNGVVHHLKLAWKHVRNAKPPLLSPSSVFSSPYSNSTQPHTSPSYKKICVFRILVEDFVLSHPQVRNFVVETDNNTATLDLIDSGTCSAGVMTSTSYDNLIANNEGHCVTKTIGGDTIFTIPVAMPVSGKFESFISTIVQRGVGERLFDTLATDFNNEIIGPPICDNNREVDTDVDEKEDGVLSIREMSLAFFSNLLCTIIGLLVYLRERYLFFWKKVGRWLKIKPIFAKIRQYLMTQIAFFKQDESTEKDAPENDPDASLKQELLLRTGPDLLSFLEGTNVSQAKLDIVMDSFPNTLPLVDLVFLHKCSQDRRDIIFMEALSQSDLYKLC